MPFSSSEYQFCWHLMHPHWFLLCVALFVNCMTSQPLILFANMLSILCFRKLRKVNFSIFSTTIVCMSLLLHFWQIHQRTKMTKVRSEVRLTFLLCSLYAPPIVNLPGDDRWNLQDEYVLLGSVNQLICANVMQVFMPWLHTSGSPPPNLQNYDGRKLQSCSHVNCNAAILPCIQRG